MSWKMLADQDVLKHYFHYHRSVVQVLDQRFNCRGDFVRACAQIAS